MKTLSSLKLNLPELGIEASKHIIGGGRDDDGYMGGGGYPYWFEDMINDMKTRDDYFYYPSYSVPNPAPSPSPISSGYGYGV